MPTPSAAEPTTILRRLGLERGDLRPTLGLAAVHVLLFAGYYVARPLRDEIAAHLSGDERDNLWEYVFYVMLAIAPVWSWFARRRTRVQLLSQTIWFFGATALVFAGLLGELGTFGVGFTGLEGEPRLDLERAFYVWSAVLALLPMSAFWSYASDVFSLERAKRVFGLLASSATIGQIIGSGVSGALSDRSVDLGPQILLVAGLFIASGAAVVLVDRFTGPAPKSAERAARDEPIGGGLVSGLLAVVRSPALRGVCVYFLLYTSASTVYYWLQSNYVGGLFTERAERRAFLADLDHTVGWITLVLQAGLSGVLMRRLGLGATLLGLPLVCIAGVVAVWLTVRDGVPVAGSAAGAAFLTLLSVVLVAQRVARYVFAKPAREALFTTVSRQERYLSKNFIDTAVYRGGDVLTAKTWTWIEGADANGDNPRFTTAQIALGAVPLMLLWGWQCLRLGRRASRTENTVP
jgi:AAA family ATP:ADP antiporter